MIILVTFSSHAASWYLLLNTVKYSGGCCVNVLILVYKLMKLPLGCKCFPQKMIYNYCPARKIVIMEKLSKDTALWRSYCSGEILHVRNSFHRHHGYFLAYVLQYAEKKSLYWTLSTSLLWSSLTIQENLVHCVFQNSSTVSPGRRDHFWHQDGMSLTADRDPLGFRSGMEWCLLTYADLEVCMVLLCFSISLPLLCFVIVQTCWLSWEMPGHVLLAKAILHPQSCTSPSHVSLA